MGLEGVAVAAPPPLRPAPLTSRTPSTSFQVKYTKGATQGGSSGAPLIDWDSKRVVGILSGGFAVCSDPSRPDYFGRLDRAWDTGLKQACKGRAVRVSLGGVRASQAHPRRVPCAPPGDQSFHPLLIHPPLPT